MRRLTKIPVGAATKPPEKRVFQVSQSKQHFNQSNGTNHHLTQST